MGDTTPSKAAFSILTSAAIFTPEELRILHRYGNTFQSLMDGERKPTTGDQQRFVRVCRGQVEPESIYEKVWRKYLDRLQWERDPENQSAMGPPRKSDEGFGGSREEIKAMRRDNRAEWRKRLRE